ncbi:MAG TPA: restriction endonuclease subunit S, partial [bacterium]|nr:restriction endonuclease subunit S [bacterium]
MKPYPKYKDSGAFWIGKVPENWKLVKTKYVFSERVEKGYPNKPLLAATQTKGVVPKSMYENRTVEAQKDLHLLKLVNPGDFVISLRSFQGGIEYSKHRGIISPAYTVMIPNNRVSDGYFRHLAKSKEYIFLLQTCVTGIREGQNINYELLRKTPMPIPPESEQIQIARYLDWQTSKIKKFIKNKKKLIALLKEQKQNIINEAVTKGINPNVKMKNSGVEWIGDVPEHWEVRRLKSLSRINSGQVDPKKEEFNRMILIAPNHIESKTGKLVYTESVAEQGAISGKYFVNKGQLLYSKIRPALRKAAIAPFDCLCSADMYGITFDRKTISNEFALISILSDYFSKYAIDCSMRVAMPKINREALGVAWMTIPPVNEQEEIIKYIYEETSLIDKTIARTER